jgi:hypothetical protein
MEPLRIGIVGAARIAELAIVKPARATGTRLVAVAARDPHRAAAFAATQRVAASYGDLLADPEIEAVYNPLPNALHGPWNLAAVKSGKHVLSEKPFAANADEATEVRDAGRRCRGRRRLPLPVPPGHASPARTAGIRRARRADPHRGERVHAPTPVRPTQAGRSTSPAAP